MTLSSHRDPDKKKHRILIFIANIRMYIITIVYLSINAVLVACAIFCQLGVGNDSSYTSSINYSIAQLLVGRHAYNVGKPSAFLKFEIWKSFITHALTSPCYKKKKKSLEGN